MFVLRFLYFLFALEHETFDSLKSDAINILIGEIKMKKTLALILALCMVLALCACGKTAAPAEEASDELVPTEYVPLEFDPLVSDPVPVSDLKIGVITLHDENSSYDRNFIDAAKDVFSELGVKDENFMLRTNIGEDETCYDAAAELADAGCNVIFSDSYGHEAYMIQAAKEFPTVNFVSATGDRAHYEGIANYHNAFASIYNGRYLAGVAAGMKLNDMIANGEFKAEEAKIGYVGAKPYAEVISGYTSFFLGARSVCPTVTMEVIYTNSWYDEALEKEAANNLIKNGCKLISEHADSMGAPTACETAGVPNVSYNLSFMDACPNTYLCGSRINWRPYFKVMVNALVDGKAIPTDFLGTLDDSGVEVLDLNTAIAAPGTAEKLAEVAKDLQSGKLVVFDTSTFTVGGKAVTSYGADVINDGTFSHETQAIGNGEFNESLYRSAPYFDMIIDGITVLG